MQLWTRRSVRLCVESSNVCGVTRRSSGPRLCLCLCVPTASALVPALRRATALEQAASGPTRESYPRRFDRSSPWATAPPCSTKTELLRVNKTHVDAPTRLDDGVAARARCAGSIGCRRGIAGRRANKRARTVLQLRKILSSAPSSTSPRMLAPSSTTSTHFLTGWSIFLLPKRPKKK